MALAGSPMSRNHVALLLERGVRKVFFDEYKLVQDQFRTIYKVVSSQKQSETDVIMAGLSTYGLKPEGQSPIFDAGGQAYSKLYTHRTWALGLEFSEELQEDELYGYAKAMGGELGRTAKYTQEVQAMDLFNDLSATVYT